MAVLWKPGDPGILALPSGRLVRGRSLRRPLRGEPAQFGLYLLNHPPPATPWPSRWLRWPDFWLPTDRAAAAAAFAAIWELAAGQRAEVGCGGGYGRTGTALACLAVLDGVPSAEAVRYVRVHYHRRAVETPWQRRYVERFSAH